MYRCSSLFIFAPKHSAQLYLPVRASIRKIEAHEKSNHIKLIDQTLVVQKIDRQKSKHMKTDQSKNLVKRKIEAREKLKY